jgi:hypothetical protein
VQNRLGVVAARSTELLDVEPFEGHKLIAEAMEKKAFRFPTIRDSIAPIVKPLELKGAGPKEKIDSQEKMQCSVFSRGSSFDSLPGSPLPLRYSRVAVFVPPETRNISRLVGGSICAGRDIVSFRSESC